MTYIIEAIVFGVPVILWLWAMFKTMDDYPKWHIQLNLNDFALGFLLTCICLPLGWLIFSPLLLLIR